MEVLDAELEQKKNRFTIWYLRIQNVYVLDPSLTSRHSQFSFPLPSDLAISTSFPRQFWFWKCRTIQNQKLTKVEKGVEDKLVLYLVLDSFIVSVASDLHKLNNQSEGVSCNRVLQYLFRVLT